MWHEPIPIEIKKKCLEMRASGFSARQIYNEYYKKLDINICAYETFRRYLTRWAEKTYPDNTTLNAGTYHGFIAHDATVQVSSNGDIVQAWIKQKSTDIDVEEFLEAIKGSVEKYEYNQDKAKEIISNYQNMINEEKYNSDILGELNVFDEIYMQPARKNCALLSSKSAVKILDGVDK